MEAHRAEYQARLMKAQSALKEGDIEEAIQVALSSYEYIDGMMQYERRYEKREFTSVKTIDLILKHAPLLFDTQSIEKLEALLIDYRRVDKNTSKSLADQLTKAKAQMWEAYQLWDHLEGHPHTSQNELRRILGGKQDQWRYIIHAWQKMGVIHLTPDGRDQCVSLMTRMDEVVLAKCSRCGVVAKSGKYRFLEELICPKCRKTAWFVILLRAPSDVKRG